MARGIYHVIRYAARKDKSKDWICPECNKYQEYPENIGYIYTKLVCRHCGSNKVYFNRKGVKT